MQDELKALTRVMEQDDSRSRIAAALRQEVSRLQKVTHAFVEHQFAMDVLVADIEQHRKKFHEGQDGLVGLTLGSTHQRAAEELGSSFASLIAFIREYERLYPLAQLSESELAEALKH